MYPDYNESEGIHRCSRSRTALTWVHVLAIIPRRHRAARLMPTPNRDSTLSRTYIPYHSSRPLLPLPIHLFPPAMFVFGRPPPPGPPRLAIPELLFEIFRDARLSRRDLSRAALVCRAWHVVADVVLWEDMPGLAPLLMLMPEDAWTMVSPGVCARDDDSRRD